MKTSALKIAAVVVTYNRRELLRECLTALMEQTRPLDEIILVDNASTDGTTEMVEELSMGSPVRLRYVKLEGNIGGAGGFSRGIAAGIEHGFDWLWVMDDDCIPGRRSLELLADHKLISDTRTNALCSTVIDVEGDICHWHRRCLDGKFNETMSTPEDYGKEYFTIDLFSFVGTLLRTERLKEIGLPSKEYFIYFDDTEYAMRLMRYGGMYVVTQSVVKHKTPVFVTEKKLTITWRLYFELRNPIRMFIKHIKAADVSSARKVVLFGNVVVWKLIGKPFFWSFLKEELRGNRITYLKVLARAVSDGLLGRFDADLQSLNRLITGGKNDARSPGAMYPEAGTVDRSIVYNLAGYVIPMIAALLVTPFLVKGMGLSRFGLLSLIWMFVGYFNLFDLGIGRATTKYVAEYVSTNKKETLPRMIWTALYGLTGFGILSAGIALVLSRRLVENILNIPDSLQAEAIHAISALAYSIPFVIGTIALRGVLEALYLFPLVNMIRLPASIAVFVIPLIVLPFSNSLYYVTWLLTASRVVVFFVHLYYCFVAFPDLKRYYVPSLSDMKLLLNFGGWITLSNIISPLMTYLDRFLIGSILSVSAVAYYATPYDMVTRLLFVAGSVVAAWFPLFASYPVLGAERMRAAADEALRKIAIIAAPIVLFTIIYAENIMDFWLGRDFALHSSLVLQVLAFGVFINSLAHVPYAVIQGAGRPDLTAKLHVIELPLYGALLYAALQTMGIVGVSLVWAFRVVFDAIALVVINRRVVNAGTAPAGGFCVSLMYIPMILGVSILIANNTTGWGAKNAAFVLGGILIVLLARAGRGKNGLSA